jgi:preprotein translocase subunit SecE
MDADEEEKTRDKDVDEPEEREEQEPQDTQALAPEGQEADPVDAATGLGAARYVLAGFFVAAIAVAYVVGRALSTAWNKVAESQWAIDKAPWLSRMSEEQRETWGAVAGGVVALGALVYVYRRQDIRQWVNESAAEMAKVTWPSKKEVTHGTIVVVVASLVATFYLALLDRFWGFVTNLVYGA